MNLLSLLSAWVQLAKSRTKLITVLASISMLGIVLIQGFFISAEVELKHQDFQAKMKKLLLDVHHSIEDDSVLSNQLIYLFRQYQNQKPLESALKNQVLKTVQFKIDSVLEVFDITSMPFDFVFYAVKKKEIVLQTPGSDYELKKFKAYSQRAGYRVKEALGKGKYRFGIYFPFEFWFLLLSLKTLLFASLLLICLLSLCFLGTILAIRNQKQLSQMKNDFINHLTHELKTPIFASSVIHQVIKQCVDEKKYDELSQHVAMLESGNEELKKGVEKVLELSILENGKLEMDFEPVDVHRIIRKSIRLFQYVVKKKGGTITWPRKADRSYALVDAIHLGNAFNSLLDNAVKYSEKAPQITFETRNDQKNLQISIRDLGKGINLKEHHLIFEKFYRSMQGNLFPVKGFGLGLPYVKMVVELHGGNISLKSQEGKGSTFIISIPLISKSQNAYVQRETVTH